MPTITELAVSAAAAEQAAADAARAQVVAEQEERLANLRASLADEFATNPLTEWFPEITWRVLSESDYLGWPTWRVASTDETDPVVFELRYGSNRAWLVCLVDDELGTAAVERPSDVADTLASWDAYRAQRTTQA